MPARLGAIYQRFGKETAMLTQTLEASIASSIHTPLTIQQHFVVELCVIRLHDAWSRFCRELVVTSAYAKPMTAQGDRVPRAPGVKRRDQVIPKLLATYKKRSQEPYWYLTDQCLDAAGRLKVSNYSAIASGIGISFPDMSPSPNDQVRLVRNFFCSPASGKRGQSPGNCPQPPYTGNNPSAFPGHSHGSARHIGIQALGQPAAIDGLFVHSINRG